MFKMKKTWIMMVLLLTVTTIGIMAAYIPNSRDTKPSPDKILYTIDRPSDMVELFDNENFTFYFRDDLDVLAIYDKKADYTYKTGLDLPYNDETEDTCEDLIDSGNYTQTDLDTTCVPFMDLSDSAKSYGNSLISLEYLDDVSGKSKNLYSADEDYSSSLSKLENDGSHWALDIDYGDFKARDREFDLKLRVHLYFTEDGVEYEIRNQEISSSEREKIISISVSPFMGAQGGTIMEFNNDTLKYDIETQNVINPGYSFVPDGSGALIRFEDTRIDVDEYHSLVYGGDLTRAYSSNITELEYIASKQATLPVFGMSFGDDTEVAFVAYATEGEQFMEIVSTPLSSNLGYVQTYAKFHYNIAFNQIVGQNEDGSTVGYLRLSEDYSEFDVHLHYDFLNGDGSSNTYEASYVGMALQYREYLLDEGLLETMDSSLTTIPLRVDFLMADSKIGIFGYEEQVSTTAEDVSMILESLHEKEVYNINSGLIGWQEGGVILTSPKDTDFSSAIGTKSDFKELFEQASLYGYDVSFVNDYAYINSDMESFRGNAVKHLNGLYNMKYLSNYQTVSEYALVNPNDATSWMMDHYDTFKDMGQTSMTIDGITSNMYGAPREDMSALDAIDLINSSLQTIQSDMVVNAYNPNLYLMQNIDRYLNMPAFSSQYIIASDTVPFLQLVLHNSVEMYAQYANFSFSSTKDILRMIDYNMYPSFVLTMEPSYVLASTNSNNYISTQFRDYEDLIVSMYQEINEALSVVLYQEWISREVVTEGLIVNTYSSDIEIVINYTDDSQMYNGHTIPRNSFVVLED